MNELMTWYDANRRALPWRQIPEPYRVWVSEIMLQQTQVVTVIPYFERFITALPTLKALAECSEEQLFKLWEGLGYYTRARNLQKAAKRVMEEYGGVLPGTFDALLDLPGIGPYTAGAIASIAFNQYEVAIDGNVIRVMSRLLAKTQSPKGAKTLVQGMQRESGRPGDFTQALMELGALVCLPKTPHCHLCPFNDTCRAHQRGTPLNFPKKPPKKPKQVEEHEVFMVFCEGRVLVEKRPDKGLLAGLWQFPFHKPKGTIPIGEMGEYTHVFTHRIWRMKGIPCHLDPPCGEGVWVDGEGLLKLPFPTAMKPFLDYALEKLES